MSELFNILSFSIFLIALFYMPFFSKGNIKINKFFFEDYNLRVLNILILITFFLIFKLLNFKLMQIITIFYSLIFIFIVYFLTNFKKFIFEKDNLFYLLSFFIILFTLSVDLSNNLTLYWDAQKLWLPKAIVFLNDGSVSELKNTPYSHYSFLGSLLWAFFWKISNFNYEYFGRMFYIALYIFALLNFLTLLKIDKYIRIISLIFLVLITYNYWHFRGTQEILIFSFLLILSKYLFRLIVENKNTTFNVITIFLILNLIIWTKNEGIILSLITIFTLLISIKEKIKFKIILFIILISLISFRFIIFKYNGLSIDLSQDFNFLNIPQIFIENLTYSNIFIISKYLLFSIFKFPHILVSLFFAILIALDKRLFRKATFLYIYLLLSIFLITFVYLCSHQDMAFMVSTGLFRLMFEFSAPYLLFILIYFKEKFQI